MRISDWSSDVCSSDLAPLPPAFVTAQTLEPASHVVMQAAVQRYIDSSVSKTINLPADISFEAFKDVYQQAYDLGCKGCTTFRPNAITGAVLSVGARETLAESADTELVQADRAIARKGAVRAQEGGAGTERVST